MAELRTILGTEYISSKDAIHDVHDTLTNTATLTTDYQLYTNDATVRDYGTATLWDKDNSIIDCSSLVEGAKIDVVLDSLIASGSQDALITVKFECPNNGSPFTLKEKTLRVKKNDTYNDDVTWGGYIGPEVKLYGIKIYSKVGVGTLDVSQRKLLVRAS